MSSRPERLAVIAPIAPLLILPIAFGASIATFIGGLFAIALRDWLHLTALQWLAVDALAPLLGTLTSLALALPDGMVAVVLAIFAGFFLYIGASDLLPESHHAHPRFFTTLSTLAGAATLYGVTQIAG